MSTDDISTGVKVTAVDDDDDKTKIGQEKPTSRDVNESSPQIETSKTSTTTKTDQTENEIEDNFWKSFVETIYSSEKLPLSSDIMQNVLIQLENCSEHVLEHEPEYESFYTALVSLCSFQFLENLNTCKKRIFLFIIEFKCDLIFFKFIIDKIEQALEMEKICSIFMQYFLNYFIKRHKQTNVEEDEPILTPVKRVI
jgi:hypothetical protein